MSVCVCVRYADDRLVSVLRHHSFLRELQEIALEGESLIKERTFGCAKTHRVRLLLLPKEQNKAVN